MIDQPGEIISGEKVIEMLRGLIDSRRVCRMEIPQTRYGWFVLLLGIPKQKESNYLSIDKVDGFEEVLADSQVGEILLEFLEKDGIRCHFKTHVTRCHRTEIWAELPDFICRVQRRAFFRIEAPSGTEITFRIDPEKEEKAKVKDYSLGGVAFFTEGSLNLNPDDKVADICLTLPQRKGYKTVHIPSAVVRRVGQDLQGKDLCALEFLQYPEETRRELSNHIIEVQRKIIRRMK